MKDDIVEVKGLIVQYKQAKDDIQEVIKTINPKDDQEMIPQLNPIINDGAPAKKVFGAAF